MRTESTQPNPKTMVNPVSFSVEAAARALGISRSLAWRLIREGQLRAVKIGRRTVVPVKECEALIARLGGVA
jgi:excisionase family DNA binding protein